LAGCSELFRTISDPEELVSNDHPVRDSGRRPAGRSIGVKISQDGFCVYREYADIQRSGRIERRHENTTRERNRNASETKHQSQRGSGMTQISRYRAGRGGETRPDVKAQSRKRRKESRDEKKERRKSRHDKEGADGGNRERSDQETRGSRPR
jgi:hypothetical protein